MDLRTPPQRGSALADLLAQFGSQQSATSAHHSLKARRESSLAATPRDSVAGRSKSAVQQTAPGHPQPSSLDRDLSDSAAIGLDTRAVSAPSLSAHPQRSPGCLHHSDDLSEENDSSDDSSEVDSNDGSNDNSNNNKNNNGTDEDSDEELETQPASPSLKPSARRARRSYPHLEGLVMENRRTKEKENITPRRSTRKKKNDILVSDTNYYYPSPKRKSAASSPRKLDTTRKRLWDEINQKTQAKASGFLVANKDVFLPLLPDKNYVSKLVADGQQPSVVPYTRLLAQPTGVTASLKPYQLDGLSFLVHLHNNGFSGILSDEMGLGKTLQTLSLFQYLEEQDRRKGVVSEESRPYLVICPLSVLNSWVNEAKKWVPGLKVLRYHGTGSERERLKRVAQGLEDQYGHETSHAKERKASQKAGLQTSKLPTESVSDSYKIIVTTYETFKAEQSWFKHSFVWRYVVLDEGHTIKSNTSQVSLALKRISSEYRLILTGTPVQNDLVELWSLLAWLFPDIFTDTTQALFKDSFDLTRGRANQQTMNDARRLLQLIMLRRMKDSRGVNLNLPPKEEVLLYVPLTPMQRFWYTRLLTRVDDAMLDDLFANGKSKEMAAQAQEKRTEETLERIHELESQQHDGSTEDEAKQKWEETADIMRQAIQKERGAEAGSMPWRRLMNLVLQLRKCCSHPYMLPGAQPEPYYIGQHIIRASGKFILLEKLLKRSIIDQGKKVLIFSGFREMLDCCESLLEMLGNYGQDFKHLRLDGDTGRARRNLEMRLFNDRKSVYKAMLLSTRAGGLGINLTTAEDVFFLDEDWNPQITLQAEARAHRIGQTKKVTIYKLCTQGTVEEQMMGRIRKKLYLSTKITESMEPVYGETATTNGTTTFAGEDAPDMDTTQLKSLVRRGAQTLSHPEIDVTEMLSWDLDTMLHKCRDKHADSHQNLDNGEVDEEKWLSVMERVETAVFDGKRYQRQLEGKSPKGATDKSNIIDTPRERKYMTVIVDGFEVSKESTRCADWEAVPTMAGKDPSLANAVREKRREYNHEEYCLGCFGDEDDGYMVWCKSCPRRFHYDCLEDKHKKSVRGNSGFYCSQHDCCKCHKNTTDAGGLLFRCRWCPQAFCEDCMDWEKEDLIGENLPEFRMIDQLTIPGGFYIKCADCIDSMEEDEGKKEWIDKMEESYAEQYDEWFRKKEKEQQLLEETRDAAQNSRRDMSKILELPAPTRLHEGPATPSLTENSTTNDESGLNTPLAQRSRKLHAQGKKRVIEPEPVIDSPKRTRYGRGAWTVREDSSSDEDE